MLHRGGVISIDAIVPCIPTHYKKQVVKTSVLKNIKKMFNKKHNTILPVSDTPTEMKFNHDAKKKEFEKLLHEYNTIRRKFHEDLKSSSLAIDGTKLNDMHRMYQKLRNISDDMFILKSEL